MSQPKEPIVQIGLNREAWGPRFWKILHTLAETAGRQTHLLLSHDEADIWEILLRGQAFVMPCEMCKKHYLEWYARNRPDGLREIRGEDRRVFLRRWFWGCHDRVNQLNDKQSPPLEEMPILYPLISFEKEYKELVKMFQLAHTKQVLKLEDTTRWRNAVTRLRNLVGI